MASAGIAHCGGVAVSGRRGSNRLDVQTPPSRTSDTKDNRLSATVAAQAMKLKQLLPQLITLVQTRLDMVYLYESLMVR